MGAGTNIQDKLIASHDLDAPWKPSDMEQRRGRIVRQGNENTVTKRPNFARLDMCYRRYIYCVDNKAITNVNNVVFADTYSYYVDIEENSVVKWFKEWCQS